MRKTFLSITLFILICFAATAQTAQYSIKKQVVGTGGFSAKPIGMQRVMSGVFGQAVIGLNNIQATGQNSTMYWGFWAWSKDTNTSVEGDPIVAKGIINYPNPASNFTSFKFNLKENSYVTINVYNNIGSLVATVAQNEFLPAGQNSIDWNIGKIANGGMFNSGAYMYEALIVPAMATHSNTYSFRNILMISK